MNLLNARYENGDVILGGHKFATTMQVAGSRDVVAGIRPGAIRITPEGLKARVDLIEHLGDTAVLDLDIGGALMRVRVGDENIPREGDTVAISVRPQDIHLFDPESRKRLS
jgi:ABC-type sugar transport system ATPase subunit